MILQGRMPIFSYAEGMARYLTKCSIQIGDFVVWAQPFTESIQEHAEKVARQAGLEIDFVRKKNFRKEQKSEQILQQRGYHPRLVWVFSALELCTTYAPQYNPDRKPSYRSAKDQKCLHYYFYFIDEVFGLCYL